MDARIKLLATWLTVALLSTWVLQGDLAVWREFVILIFVWVFALALTADLSNEAID